MDVYLSFSENHEDIIITIYKKVLTIFRS